MKIILVCSSLEPGRDGVGDFARMIGAELVLQGHTVDLMAINDKFTKIALKQVQPVNGLDIPVLRLPFGLDETEKIAKAKSWIADINPDLLSLQYVPFGYHIKGLPFGLANMLADISKGRNWEIMFHELWVGMAREESVKLKLWGKLQRYIVRSLIRKLTPQIIHTQTHLYQALLTKMGYTALYLPICSNIPVVAHQPETISTGVRLIVFGLIHTGAAIDGLAAEALTYSNKYNTPVTLVFAGHCGAEQDKWIEVWRQAGLNVEVHGQQPAKNISVLLHGATLGLSSTAIAVTEKSGSLAAMRAHALPVLNISKPWTPIGVAGQPVPPGVIEYVPGQFEAHLIRKDQYIVDGITPAQIARQMLNDMVTNA